MDRSYLILLFTAALLVVLTSWLVYTKLATPPPAAQQPATTQPLVERLRAERERRLRERGELPDTTRPTTAPADPA